MREQLIRNIRSVVYRENLCALNYFENLRWYTLGNIVIHPTNLSSPGFTAPYTNMKFVYSESPTERVNLNEIKIFANDFEHNPHTSYYNYSFEYDDFDELPSYLSLKEDHWGFDKGTNFTFSSSPNLGVFANHYNEREANAEYTIKGMLKKIIWPTKGFTEFEYERNDFLKYISDDRSQIIEEPDIAGGARIKSITENTGIISSTKHYKYVKNYNLNHSSTISSGILNFKNRYYWEDWDLRVEPGVWFSQTVFSNNAIVPQSNFSGSHLGYSEVVEILPDDSYKIFKYANFDTDTSYLDQGPDVTFDNLNNVTSPYNKFNDMTIKRGKILTETSYTPNDKKVKEIQYNYITLTGSESNNFIIGTNAN